MRVYALRPAQVEYHRDVLQPLMLRAVERRGSGGFDPFQVFDDAVSGKSVIWVVFDEDRPLAVLVTGLETWPEGKVLRVQAMAGRGFRKWAGMAREALEAHAHANGAINDSGEARMVAEGRKGLGRILGVEPTRYVFETGMS